MWKSGFSEFRALGFTKLPGGGGYKLCFCTVSLGKQGRGLQEGRFDPTPRTGVPCRQANHSPLYGPDVLQTLDQWDASSEPMILYDTFVAENERELYKHNALPSFFETLHSWFWTIVVCNGAVILITIS